MKIIAVYNNKGGVGKTTVSYHIAILASERGTKVLVVGLDPQGDVVRWTHGDPKNLREDEVVTKSPTLTAMYQPDGVPEVEGVDLMVVDCSPALEVSVTVNPDLWVVPIDGRLSVENLFTVIGDLQASGAPILIVINKAGLAGRRALNEIKKAISTIEHAAVAEVMLPESGVIARSAEMYRSVWDVPWSSTSKAPGKMTKLCEQILRMAGVKLSPAAGEREDDGKKKKGVG